MKSKKKDPEDDLQSGPSIGRILDLDPATLRRWRREGMPHHDIGPRLVRYKLSEVLAWRAQRPRKSKKEVAS
jgi:hypothetical protein